MSFNGREALLQWCKQQTSKLNPAIQVENFTSSWRDGNALCALVASIWPKSIEMNALPNTPEKRLELALKIASDKGLPQLVDASEFKTDEVENSLVMFISQLFQIFKKNRPPSEQLTGEKQGRQSQVVSNLQYCGKCNNPLSLINVECGGKNYHTQCFCCSLCETKLTQDCIIIGGKPFCSTCGKKSFKMATWKLHKKEKEKWWQDVWRNSQQAPGIRFEGWNKDGAEKRTLTQKDATEVGKLPPSEFEEEFIDSDDEKELKAKAESAEATPAPAPSTIQPDDELLDEIDDEAEKRAFVELFARLPEPEPSQVQLGLSLTAASGAGGSHSRASFAAPAAANSPLSGKEQRSRAHRSAMLIPASSVPPPLPPKPPGGLVVPTKGGSAASSSTSNSSEVATTNNNTAVDNANKNTSTSPGSTVNINVTNNVINNNTINNNNTTNNNVTNNNVTNNNVVNVINNNNVVTNHNTVVYGVPPLPTRTLASPQSVRNSLPPSLPNLSTRSITQTPLSSSPPGGEMTSTSLSISPQSSPHSSPRSISPSRDSIYSNFSDFESALASSAPLTLQADRMSQPQAPPPAALEKGRFSRMFAASVSKLLLAETPEDSEDPAIKEGFLVKKMDLGVVRPWQRRYFLLKRDQLMYFMNKECREKGLTLGIIPLNSVKNINPISPAKWSRFELVGEGGMKWYLQADTRNDMVEWMSTLRKACKVKNEEKLQDLASSAGLSLKSLEKKEGTVDIKHKTAWVSRWIVLKDGVLWAYSSKDGSLKAKVPLYKCQLNEYQPPTGLLGQLMDWSTQNSGDNSHCFQITSPNRSMIVRTSSVEQMHAWLNAILKQKVVVEEIIENIALEPLSL